MNDPENVTAARSSTRRRAAVVAAVVATLLAAAVIFLLREPPAETAAPAPRAAPSPTSSPTPSPSPSPSRCADPADEPFKPTKVTIPGVIRNATVLALPRDARDVPSVPPLSGGGKQQIAWDRPPGIRPGETKGNMLLNAHTWPDGSALGNELLSDLRKGDRIIVRNKKVELCYRVDKKVEVLASSGYPPYYDTEGKHQLALLVCSGQRLGPGSWTHRTIWFASPEEPRES